MTHSLSLVFQVCPSLYLVCLFHLSPVPFICPWIPSVRAARVREVWTEAAGSLLIHFPLIMATVWKGLSPLAVPRANGWKSANRRKADGTWSGCWLWWEHLRHRPVRSDSPWPGFHYRAWFNLWRQKSTVSPPYRHTSSIAVSGAILHLPLIELSSTGLPLV